MKPCRNDFKVWVHSNPSQIREALESKWGEGLASVACDVIADEGRVLFYIEHLIKACDSPYPIVQESALYAIEHGMYSVLNVLNRVSRDASRHEGVIEASKDVLANIKESIDEPV